MSNECPNRCFASQDEPRNIEDAKRICRWSVLKERDMVSRRDYYLFDQVGHLAANILARAGVIARVDSKSGKVTFHDTASQAQETEISEATA